MPITDRADLPPTPELVADIRAALSKADIPAVGEVRSLVSGRVYAVDSSVVIKLRSTLTGAIVYLKNLATFQQAGIPSEEPLALEPLLVGDQWAVVTKFIEATEPTGDHHARAVGRLLRRIHDEAWPWDEPREPDEVYCPNDWQQVNVLIVRGQPIMVDLETAEPFDRDTAVTQARGHFLLDEDGPADHEFMSGYGAHPDLRTYPNPA